MEVADGRAVFELTSAEWWAAEQIPCAQYRTGRPDNPAWALDPGAVSDRLAAGSACCARRRRSGSCWSGSPCSAGGLDHLALTAAATAVGIPVAWAPLALGFLAVQVSIALQVLPGGAGLAEAGLLGTLVAAGVGAGPTRRRSWCTG